MTNTNRSVNRLISHTPTLEGAGVTVRRTIGSAALNTLDPFLLLDELKSATTADAIAGFPDHPHRGFETVSYVISGKIEHRDSRGNQGEITAGAVQWMTAGAGIIHSEMPKNTDEPLWGFQLWINLPSQQKMCQPRYQEIRASEIPCIKRDNGVTIRLIAGQIDGQEGPILGVSCEPCFLDISCPPKTNATIPISPHHTGFCYPYQHNVEVTNTPNQATLVKEGTLAILSHGDSLSLYNQGPHPCQLLCVTGMPINEPIARYGPFVMNTKTEIMQAIDDYQNGRMG